MSIDAGPSTSSLPEAYALRMRCVTCELTIETNDYNGKKVRNGNPVFVLCGILDDGSKICAHIHGVSPYVILKTAGGPTQETLNRLKQQLNRLIQSELDAKRQGDRAVQPNINTNFITKLVPDNLKSIYGFYPEEESFVRVYCDTPYHHYRLVQALNKQALHNPQWQPYEAHFPAHLQFFIDHGIYGMDYVYFKNVKFRINPRQPPEEEIMHGLTIEEITSTPGLRSFAGPMSHCKAEVDALASDILNASMHKKNVHSSNPGLDMVWSQEKSRCDALKIPFKDPLILDIVRTVTKTEGEMKLAEDLTKIRDVYNDMHEEASVSKPGDMFALNVEMKDVSSAVESADTEGSTLKDATQRLTEDVEIEDDVSANDRDMEGDVDAWLHRGVVNEEEEREVNMMGKLVGDFRVKDDLEVFERLRKIIPPAQTGLRKKMKKTHGQKGGVTRQKSNDEFLRDANELKFRKPVPPGRCWAVLKRVPGIDLGKCLENSAKNDPIAEDTFLDSVRSSVTVSQKSLSSRASTLDREIPRTPLATETVTKPNTPSLTYSQPLHVNVCSPISRFTRRNSLSRRNSLTQPSSLSPSLSPSMPPSPLSDPRRIFANVTSVPSPFRKSLSLDETNVISATAFVIEHVSAVSLEIIAQTKAEYPDVKKDPIIAASITLYRSVCEKSDDPPEHIAFVVAQGMEVSDNETIVPVENEGDLIDGIVNYVRSVDPDILVGYDTRRLSWGYLIQRGKYTDDKQGVTTLMERLSRYSNDFEDRRYKTEEEEEFSLRAPHGRIILTVWKTFRFDPPLRAYDRGTATKELLKKRISVAPMNILSDKVLVSDPFEKRCAIGELAKYSSNNIDLLLAMNYFSKTAEMARVFGLLFQEVFTRGTQLRVESMLARTAHAENYTLPSVSPILRTRMCAPEQLQLVMEPASGVYIDPVIVLDFQSLYPSIVMAYNLCYSTLLGKLELLKKADREIELGALRFDVPYSELRTIIDEKKVFCSPQGSAFVHPSVREGILPRMLREIIGARLMVKQAAKRVTSKRHVEVLDARQLALKLVANVSYGYTAANWSGRMPCVELADAILGKARETLEIAIKMVNEGEYEGSRVIYGDTDSLFVLCPGATKETAFRIGRKIAADVTSTNPDPIVLKLEKVFMGCVLETKKRYAGMKFESEEDKGELQSKGIETIRRDTCPIVAETLERALKLVFREQHRRLSEYLCDVVTNISFRPLNDFVFAREYRGHYEEGAPVPQRKVHDSIKSICAAAAPLKGERVPYVILDGDDQDTVISCVRGYSEAQNDPRVKLNFDYYISSHIIPAIKRVLNLAKIPLSQKAPEKNLCASLRCREQIAEGFVSWCEDCGMCPIEKENMHQRVERLKEVQWKCEQRCKTCSSIEEAPTPADCRNNSCFVKQTFVHTLSKKKFCEKALESHSPVFDVVADMVDKVVNDSTDVVDES